MHTACLITAGLSLLSAVAAQTSTDCNPTESEFMLEIGNVPSAWPHMQIDYKRHTNLNKQRLVLQTKA